MKGPDLPYTSTLLVLLSLCLMSSGVVDLCASECSCSWRHGAKVMVCAQVYSLPMLNRSQGSDQVVQELMVTHGSRIDSIMYNQLYSHHLTDLKKISMVNCQLQQIDPRGFYAMVQLQHVHLSHNRLSHLGSGQFSPLPSLQVLDLSYNQITVFSSDLSQSPRLQTLLLQGNLLTTLSKDTLPGPGARLRRFELYGNPWHCDCHLLHLRDPLGPERLEALCPGDLICAPSLTLQRLGGHMGVSRLRCEGSAWPTLWPHWTRDGESLPLEELELLEETEKDDTVPRVVISSLSSTLPGTYTCHLGSDEASLRLPSSHSSIGLGPLLGVTVTTAIILLLLMVVFLYFLYHRAQKSEGEPSPSNSFRVLPYITSIPNPLPKPPRTFSQELLLTPGSNVTSLASPQFSNTPGSRASIGTASMMSIDPVPVPTLHSSGYVTLPRSKFCSPMLLLRSPGDGCSQISSEKVTEYLEAINTVGLPTVPTHDAAFPVNSSVQECPILQAIQEQE